MPEFDISGVLVKFPFEPYPVQRKYMEKVIQTLDEGQNAFLESPTGTGKTLCLLCATLGWVERERNKTFGKNENENGAMVGKISEDEAPDPNDVFRRNPISPFFPRVIYASRTHSQIQQAMKELKRTDYKYMKAGIVASRDQLCINEELKDMSNTDKMYMCASLAEEIKKGKEGCPYFGNVYDGLEHLKSTKCSIPDIEDLDRAGRMTKCCPYYMSKDIVTRADIVFMPYNYLFDPKIRHANTIDLKKAIVILDEAHNVENMCEESACTVITSTNIGIALRDIKYIIENEIPVKDVDEHDSKSIIELEALIQKMETEIHNIKMKSSFGGESHDGNFIFELLKKAGINEDNQQSIIDLLHNLTGALVNETRKVSIVTENGVVSQKCPKGIGLRALMSFLRIVFSSSAQHLKDRVENCYKIYIKREEDKKSVAGGVTTVEKAHPGAKIINVWCFSAAFGMQYLLSKKLRSLIFTSGTLAPLKPLITEMDISNPIQLINPHIVKSFQVSVNLVRCGPDSNVLNSNFRNRDNEVYLRSLGKAILKFSKVVPDGLLVFFPSYGVMEKCVDFWQTSPDGIWTSINEEKRIFLEPRTKIKEDFVAAMKNYYATIDDPDSSGAIFMAVMRGKVSEGLDFADMYGRGVIVAGIPLAPCHEPKIKLKRKYLDDNRTSENEMLSGQEWYDLSAIRAINQAIGRVIRHKDDYGAILFCDDRFTDPKHQENLSGWLKKYLNNWNPPFNATIGDLREFYENAKQMLPEPKPRVPEIVVFEDDFAFIDPTTDGEVSGLAKMGGNDDEGPPPATPFKNFGTKSSCDANQSGVRQKRLKFEVDSNGNQSNMDVMDRASFGFK